MFIGGFSSVGSPMPKARSHRPSSTALKPTTGGFDSSLTRRADCSREPLVVLDDRAEGFSRMNEEILRFFTQRGCAPCDIRRTEQIETLGLKLSECKGYALTPASLQFPHRDYLRAIPLEEEDISFPLCFFFRTDRLSPVLTRFFEYAEQFVLLSGDRGWGRL